LAWLIRDNRHLLKAVAGGQCSNGTAFENVTLNDADCPFTASTGGRSDNSNSFCPESEFIAPCKCMNHGFEPNGLMALDCNRLNLNDEDASYILNTFIHNSSDYTLLRHLSLVGNLLTRIPREIRLFPRLTELHFGINQIGTIRAIDFNFTSPIVNDQEMVQIHLVSNVISYIEPGAFDGKRCLHYYLSITIRSITNNCSFGFYINNVITI